MAEDMAELLRALARPPVYVVGLSMGGAVALQLALNHASHVQGLVLVNTSARLRPGRVDGWIYYALRYSLLYLLSRRAQARMVARRTFPHGHQEKLRRLFAAQICEANVQGYRAALRALGFFDVSDRLAEIQARTLVVTGERDTTIPPVLQRFLADSIPGARQVVIGDGGHAVPADQPHHFNKVLLDFLDSGS
jgi:pimeloyl-ACP methyl ester carboxylesterase